MTTVPMLELRGVDKSFGPVHVLSSVDFTARAGEVTALVGDNGAGKTTLVKCIGGIHPVDAGELIEAQGGGPRERARDPAGEPVDPEPLHHPEDAREPEQHERLAHDLLESRPDHPLAQPAPRASPRQAPAPLAAPAGAYRCRWSHCQPRRRPRR